jgi:hypothetical protein
MKKCCLSGIPIYMESRYIVSVRKLSCPEIGLHSKARQICQLFLGRDIKLRINMESNEKKQTGFKPCENMTCLIFIFRFILLSR